MVSSPTRLKKSGKNIDGFTVLRIGLTFKVRKARWLILQDP